MEIWSFSSVDFTPELEKVRKLTFFRLFSILKSERCLKGCFASLKGYTATKLSFAGLQEPKILS